MRKTHLAALATGAMLIAAPALAQSQTTPSEPAAPAASASAKASVTDEEVNHFATAAIAVEKTRADTSMADAEKGKAMVATIQANGLTPARFNEIAQASQADPALQARVQGALTAQQKPAQ